MATLTQRCRQCGWTHETDAEKLPRDGVRVRCADCGSLLPLLANPDDAARGERAASQPAEAAAESASAAGGALRANDRSRPAAQEIVRRWLMELAHSEPRPLTEALVLRKYGGELARLLVLWQGSHPGREAADLFREELLAALTSGAADGDAGAARPLWP
jgi:hypothetical protein